MSKQRRSDRVEYHSPRGEGEGRTGVSLPGGTRNNEGRRRATGRQCQLAGGGLSGRMEPTMEGIGLTCSLLGVTCREEPVRSAVLLDST